MIIGGEILGGIFGNGAYDVILAAFRSVWSVGPVDPAGELAATLTAAALERAIARFFDQHGDAFGRPGISFLARAENYQRVMQLIYCRGSLPDQLEIIRDGFDDAPPATPEAAQAFIHLVEEEMRKHLSLDRLLTDKANDRRLEHVATAVDSIANAAFTHALRPTAPASPAGFVDRDDTRKALRSVLLESQPAALLGMGGMGKTATALRVVADMNNDFTGGALWGSLAAHVGDPLPILRTWSTSCGFSLEPTMQADEVPDIVRAAVSGYVARYGRVVAVVDDVREEWIDSLLMLRASLPLAIPLLVTSRHDSVGVAVGAKRYRLDPLTGDFGIGLLKSGTADRMSSDDVRDLEALASEVGNLPLALVLLGRRLALTAAKPGSHIADLLREVRHRPLDAPHFTGEPQLRAVFRISYDALHEQVRTIFRCVGAFARPVVALSDVAGVAGLALAEVEAALDALVLSSMADWNSTPGEYVFHPLLHEFAKSILEADRNAKGSRRRHAFHFVEHANRQAEIAEHDKAKAYATIEEVFAEYEIASDYLASSADIEAAKALDLLASALWQESGFLRSRGEFARAIPILERAYHAACNFQLTTARSVHAGHVGVCLSHLGHLPEAIRYAEEAVQICRSEGNTWDECAHLGNLGTFYQAVGERDRALELFEAALAGAERSQHIHVAQDVLGHLGSAYRYHEPVRAKRYYVAAREVAERIGDAIGVAAAISNLGLLLMDVGDLENAEKLILDALARAEQLGDKRGIANRLGHLGNICFLTDC